MKSSLILMQWSMRYWRERLLGSEQCCISNNISYNIHRITLTATDAVVVETLLPNLQISH